jgi:hypothetical protein
VSEEAPKDARSRSWSLWGPCSGGAYTLTVTGDRVTHSYRGDCAPPDQPSDVSETVFDWLQRGRDPLGLSDARLDAAIAEARAGLDGWYALPYGWRGRFDTGRPRELAGDACCADAGRGGHRCYEGCIGAPASGAHILPFAERVAGVALRIVRAGYRDHPSDPYAAEEFAELAPADR